MTAPQRHVAAAPTPRCIDSAPKGEHVNVGDVTCAVCRHRTTTAGRVCTPCTARMREQLWGLLRQLAQLHLNLVPGAAPDGPRVSTSRVGSPTTARLDALSILGPGSDAVYARHLDDQVGDVPPEVWLNSWERAWRKILHAYQGGRHNPPSDGRPTAMDITLPGPVRLDPDAVRTLLHTAAGPAALASMFVVGRAWRQHREQLARVQVGYRDRGERRGADPLVDEWVLRFGPAARVPAAQVRFFLRWLDRACEHEDMPIDDFAAELRAVSFELGYALGEVDKKTRLGRCPNQIVNSETGKAHYCGAELWQDPYTGVTYDGGGRPDGIRVQCPRCRAGWGPHRLELVRLFADIRKVWPVDRRRRYRTADRHALCRCGGRIDITWREVTATDDRVRWWQPVTAVCVNGCVHIAPDPAPPAPARLTATAAGPGIAFPDWVTDGRSGHA